jgi:predicted ATPase
MRFETRRARSRPRQGGPDGAYLEADNWDDFGYKTLWTLWVVTRGEVHEVGGVKIADVEDTSRPPVPDEFTQLSDGFFSLGQDEDYYDNLNKLGAKVRREVLIALNDIALNLTLFDDVRTLDVTRTSLLRWVQPEAVKNQLHRMALGGAKLSPYSFWYESSTTDRYGTSIPPCRLTFDVDPSANPRTNVHVLIGRNGVGKSFILNDIATSLTRSRDAAGSVAFAHSDDDRLTQRFANVVSVAYSAFDAFMPRRQSAAADALRYHYIGLKRIPANAQDKSPGVKDHRTLAVDFGKSIRGCVDARRLPLWRRTLEFLSSDPLFAEIVSRLARLGEAELQDEAREIFGGLSSGHKIVLLILTRLVETVEEATLVLIDEPESHLHPPLLAAFMGALSELLEDRNGVAIIATHSPVVVQEVPSNCVWKLVGSGGELRPERPNLETYGENVGTLTQEIFGLEVTASGFHRALAEAVRDHTDWTYRQLLLTFDERLGAEARAILRSMVRFARN